jgi:hypothetical protein
MIPMYVQEERTELQFDGECASSSVTQSCKLGLHAWISSHIVWKWIYMAGTV